MVFEPGSSERTEEPYRAVFQSVHRWDKVAQRSRWSERSQICKNTSNTSLVTGSVRFDFSVPDPLRNSCMSSLAVGVVGGLSFSSVTRRLCLSERVVGILR